MDSAVNARVTVAVSVIGLLQLVSAVTLLLHCTGFITQNSVILLLPIRIPARLLPVSNVSDLFQMDSVTELKNHSEAVIKDTVVSERSTRNVRATIIHWNADQGHLSRFRYHDGRILVQKSGLYYIYAKTCFRHHESLETEAGSGPGSSDAVQLIQYVFHERVTHSAPSRTVLMKTGSTRSWRRGAYDMCCHQQAGLFPLRDGDAVYVSVSNSWMLDPEAEGSYFGAFRISK
ncbi:Tumor necrosis factor ligand superfamily member 11 [Anabarilius grahami]|uniref:Tumor necrosis factor ligand superfamily member 11 n=1 Tax=Anabarilius grahami TaxID=495550 RepID=A0A3N0XY57_ANAGA|nr:Tumor necrosis factor ligand superfamily member 11 [Anabarilius grahami]